MYEQSVIFFKSPGVNSILYGLLKTYKTLYDFYTCLLLNIENNR